MEIAKIVARYPKIYHMAEADTWPSIRRHGLLSATAVLDHAQLSGAHRISLESVQRPEKTTVNTIDVGAIVLRDQKPMEEKRLIMALQDGITPRQWYERINSKVFFWVQEHRLHGLLSAAAYADLEHDVLTLDTASLLRVHHDDVWLCHMNSGNTFPIPHHRGATTFQRIPDYPTTATGRPQKEVVELTVDYQVADIARHVVEVRRMKGPDVLRALPLK